MPYLKDPREVGRMQIVSDAWCWQHDCVLRWCSNWNRKRLKSMKKLQTSGSWFWQFSGEFSIFIRSMNTSRTNSRLDCDWVLLSVLRQGLSPKAVSVYVTPLMGRWTKPELRSKSKIFRSSQSEDFLRRYLFELAFVHLWLTCFCFS